MARTGRPATTTTTAVATVDTTTRRPSAGVRAQKPTKAPAALRGATTSLAIRPATSPKAAPSRMAKVGEYKPVRGVKADWQADAFSFVETIEPVGYVVHLTANTAAACDLVIGYREPDGGVVTSGDKVKNVKAKAALDALKGPRGGQYELMRRAVLLLTICGEFHLLGTAVPDQPEAYWWEALSPLELIPSETDPGHAKRNKNGVQGSVDVDPENDYLARVWRSDPRFSDRADCALKRCLDTCRELSMLNQMMEAVITTRLPAGLLLIPAKMRHKSPLQRQAEQAGNTGDEVEEEEPEFIDDLLEHLSAPVENLRSAAALVPLVVEGEAEDLKEIRTVDLGKELDVFASQLRSEMVRRLALGLDIPPETLEGKAGLNHWTGFNVDADFLFKHVKPVGDLAADGFTNAYFQPLLEREGMRPDEAARYVLLFDTSPVSGKPDESENAMRLWEAMVISDRKLIEAQGWDPDTVMPEEEEMQRRLLTMILLEHTPNVRLTDEALKKIGLKPDWIEWIVPTASPFGFPTDVAPLDPNAPKNAPQPGQPGQVPGTNGQGQQPGKIGADAPRGAGEARQPVASPERQQAARTLLIERLRMAADAHRDRLLEIAGGRIQSKAKTARGYTRDFAHRPKALIPSMVDPVELTTLGLTVDRLLGPDPWEPVQTRAKALITAYLEETGSPSIPAARMAATLAGQLGATLSEWLLETLHTEVPYCPDLVRCPVELVARHVPQPADPPQRRRELVGAR